jgi:hypothetical protein
MPDGIAIAMMGQKEKVPDNRKEDNTKPKSN